MGGEAVHMAVFDFLALASDGLICCPPTTIMFSPSAMLPALFVLRVFAFAAPAHEPSRQSSPCHCSSTPLPVDPPCCFLLPPPAAPSCCPLLVELESINCCSPPMSLFTPASLSHSHMHLLFSHFRHCPTLLSHFPVQETIIYFINLTNIGCATCSSATSGRKVAVRCEPVLGSTNLQCSIASNL